MLGGDQQAESVVKAGGELVHAQPADAGGRQLQGQRDPVQPSADGGHCGGVGRIDRKAGRGRGRPGHEQLHRTERLQRTGLGVEVRAGGLQRGNDPQCLAG